jgi:alpha-tubulin suppressor-like RCC1 family protein
MLSWPANIKQEPFKFISSGEEHNLAVTVSGKVFGFGRNLPNNKISDSSKELLYFE